MTAAEYDEVWRKPKLAALCRIAADICKLLPDLMCIDTTGAGSIIGRNPVDGMFAYHDHGCMGAA